MPKTPVLKAPVERLLSPVAEQSGGVRHNLPTLRYRQICGIVSAFFNIHTISIVGMYLCIYAFSEQLDQKG